MGRYAFQRLLMAVPTFIGASILIFALIHLLPGDIIVLKLQDIAGPSVASDEAALRAALGLDQPAPIQYFRWIGGVVQGDFGDSLWRNTPVAAELPSRMLATTELAVMALLVSLVIAIPIGIASAVWQNSPIDYLARLLAVLGVSIPSFYLAIVILLFLSLQFGWVPPLRLRTLTDDPVSNLQQYFLPALIVGAASAATLTRMTRSSLLEVLRLDYVRTARAKGLSERAVVLRHALRNSLIPVVTLVGTSFGHLLSGTVVIESIFGIPGMGRLLVDSINQRDYPIVQAVLLLFVGFFVLINLVVDLTYSVLDPRIGHGGGKGA